MARVAITTEPRPQHEPAPPLLAVSGLRVRIRTRDALLTPVAGVDFTLHGGETLALLGESGCGKSMTALAIARLLPDSAGLEAQALQLGGEDLLACSEAAMRAVRGGRIGMVFQEPGTSLNPVMTVHAQIAEVLARHRALRGAAARAEARRLLEAVGIADAGRRLDDYPFQFSGGMKQRVMIAMALAGDPELLIADEPTTALDVTIQVQVLDLLARLQAERGMGMLLITHDLGVVARMAHRVGVMYAGELVESAPRADFFAAPLHPYARKLFAALPDAAQRERPLDALGGSVPGLDQAFAGCRFAGRCPQVMALCRTQAPAWQQRGTRAVRCHLYADNASAAVLASALPAPFPPATPGTPQAVLSVRDLQVHFPVRKGLLRRAVGQVRAVDGVSLDLHRGRTLALVGESGCGKTTVGKALLQLIAANAGSVRLDGEELAGRTAAQLLPMRRAMQMVFQDPFASLNPRMSIGAIIEEGMQALGVGADDGERRRRADALLERIGLSAAMRNRYPHEFSGGQRQRIAIARALAVSPRVLVCDEPTSALDVSVQAQLLNLMRELQREMGLAYLFITHNLAVVEYLADEVAVMYLGRIVESGSAAQVLGAPAHPYTRMLRAAIPRIDAAAPAPATAAPAAELPSALAPPSGCHFHPRCPHADELCRRSYPPPRALAGGHLLHCHHPLGAEAPRA
ncbi:ABC transporter ATP-binding protein [Pseudothauera lacus]|uniref:ABC transporter ATP-binding protein n=1 Tax=Pseudothauera lacus TaxID=2136175 RepID=A0A2T4IJW7_9RHOO|nr:ABC transporter ATP-binding protein [Pseudothauera lacus]